MVEMIRISLSNISSKVDPVGVTGSVSVDGGVGGGGGGDGGLI